MQKEKQQPDKWEEQTREKPRETVPICYDEKPDIASKPDDATKSKENVTKHSHCLLLAYEVV